MVGLDKLNELKLDELTLTILYSVIAHKPLFLLFNFFLALRTGRSSTRLSSLTLSCLSVGENSAALPHSLERQQ